MVLVILAVIAGLLPSLGLFFWLRKRELPQEDYVEACNKALLYGFLSTLLTIAGSAIFQVIGNLTHILDIKVVGEIYHSFILIALVEEGAKFFCMTRLIKKYRYSWLSVTIYMTIVAIVLIILLIRFVIKGQRQEKYITLL